MVDLVVKIGGGLLAHSDAFQTALAIVSDAAQRTKLVVVPGGGPFADAVRRADQQVRLSADAAHWMAVLAMDQYACLVADRTTGSMLVRDRSEITAALQAKRLPVLAPYRWLRDVDPLPHSWDVTSDSIAAWIAGILSAPRLVLIKPPGTKHLPGGESVDGYFARALTPGVTPVIVDASQVEGLRSALFSARTRSLET